MKNKILGTFFLIFGLFLIINSGKSIIYLWNAGKRVDESQSKLKELQKENLVLKNKLNEVKSTDYVEKIARNDLNLSKDGEKVVILPEEIQKIKPPEIAKKDIPNWQKWYQLFF